MMKKYLQEVKDFIAENVKGTTTKKLALLVNAKFGTDFTESKMHAYKSNYKLKSGTKCGLTLGESRVYPPEIRKFIKGNCIGVGSKEMAELLNKTFGTSYTKSQIKAYYGNHNINSGLNGQFPKGHIPQNKGKKGTCPPGCEVTWFKKGSVPINHRPVGNERIDTDGYTLIKTAEPNVYTPKHKVIWEEKNGKVPKGHVITFLDGDKGNITLENLELITMNESLQLTRSKLRSSNPEFTKTGILIVKVKIIRRKAKV
jgi:hypothetical protein